MVMLRRNVTSYLSATSSLSDIAKPFFFTIHHRVTKDQGVVRVQEERWENRYLFFKYPIEICCKFFFLTSPNCNVFFMFSCSRVFKVPLVLVDQTEAQVIR